MRMRPFGQQAAVYPASQTTHMAKSFSTTANRPTKKPDSSAASLIIVDIKYLEATQVSAALIGLAGSRHKAAIKFIILPNGCFGMWHKIHFHFHNQFRGFWVFVKGCRKYALKSRQTDYKNSFYCFFYTFFLL